MLFPIQPGRIKFLLKLLLLILLFSFVLSGCADSVEDYYPLKVGNRWVYKTTNLISHSVTESQDLILKRELETYFFDTEEQVIKIGSGALVNKSGHTILKAPLSKGRSWKGKGNRYSITDKGATYIVPFGQYTDTLEVTFVIERPDADDSKKIYTDVSVIRYAKGIGPIYFYYEVKHPDGKTAPIFKSELTKFENIRDNI